MENIVIFEKIYTYTYIYILVNYFKTNLKVCYCSLKKLYKVGYNQKLTSECTNVN